MIQVNCRFATGTYTARAQGKTASCTQSAEMAVRALARKFGCPDSDVIKQVGADKGGSKTVWEISEATAAPVASKEHSMQVLNLALRIADICVRSEIELFAHGRARGLRVEYDTSKPCEHEDSRPEDNAANLRRVADALRYIELRGDAFPWRLVRDGSFPNIVHFEVKR